MFLFVSVQMLRGQCKCRIKALQTRSGFRFAENPLYKRNQSSPVSPRSSSTSDPALPSNSPLRHSRVSAAARLISSSRIHWPFFTAWAKVPYRGATQRSELIHWSRRTAQTWKSLQDPLPPQRQRPWPSHRLGSAAESDSAWEPRPPTSPAAGRLYKHTDRGLSSSWCYTELFKSFLSFKNVPSDLSCSSLVRADLQTWSMSLSRSCQRLPLKQVCTWPRKVRFCFLE